MATAKQLGDKPECSMCAEVYKDPRLLPCGHTFCRACIEAMRRPSCPLCSKRFALPNNGVDDLPKNFALVEVLRSKGLSIDCDVCSGGEAASAAAVFCVECRQNLCRPCEDDHNKFNVTRRHRTVQPDGSRATNNVDDSSPHTNTRPTGSFVNLLFHFTPKLRIKMVPVGTRLMLLF